MRILISTLIASLVVVGISLPYHIQLALVNSLEVGRQQNPNKWQCQGCDDSNKPLISTVIKDDGKAVKAILSVYDQYTILAFRYTANLQNIWQDLLYASQVQDQHACSGCKVQKEYDSMWNTIRKQTLQKLDVVKHTRRLIITGISLGGGLACISFVDIQKSGIFDNVEVITFGAPRIGNSKWAQWFDKQTTSTRFFIKNDPIPLLPRCLALCNYRQQGIAIECNKNKEICYKKNSVESASALGNALSKLPSGIMEHMMEEGQDVGGIIDHIFGYKKIKDYTLQL